MKKELIFLSKTWERLNALEIFDYMAMLKLEKIIFNYKCQNHESMFVERSVPSLVDALKRKGQGFPIELKPNAMFFSDYGAKMVTNVVKDVEETDKETYEILFILKR